MATLRHAACRRFERKIITDDYLPTGLERLVCYRDEATQPHILARLTEDQPIIAILGLKRFEPSMVKRHAQAGRKVLHLSLIWR
jgi:hypothetical protein